MRLPSESGIAGARRNGYRISFGSPQPLPRDGDRVLDLPHSRLREVPAGLPACLLPEKVDTQSNHAVTMSTKGARGRAKRPWRGCGQGSPESLCQSTGR